MPTFRVHTTEGKIDIDGGTADEVRKVVEKRSPETKILKIKVVK